MQKYLPKHLSNKTIALPSCLPKKRKKDWQHKPTSWPDIRKNTQNGHIYLLCDIRYPIGFTATVSNGYYVSIDGTLYGSYDNEEQFSMANWSDYTATEGYAINYPTDATKAHILDIYPQNSANNITAFRCKRVAASGQESQGVLWEHFNLTNEINLYQLNCSGNLGEYTYANTQLIACTAKNNKINCSSVAYVFFRCANLEYIPELINRYNVYNVFMSFANCEKLANINIKMSASGNNNYAFYNCKALKSFPKGLNLDNISGATDFLTQAKSLQDTVIDFSKAKTLNKVGIYSNSNNFANGIKGLRVSNEAPFNNATAPQINVSYTGMDRAALVQLFNDLPTVSAGQIINIVGCTGASNLTADDELIATAKGWTITK